MRERKDDIPLLAKNFIDSSQNSTLSLSAAALKKLENYPWPGNVRQLHNVINRAIILSSEGSIKPDHISLEEEGSKFITNQTLKELEEQILLDRLAEFQGNKTRAAKSLGVSVRWIQKKMKELNSQS